MSKKITIRNATPQDAKALLKIYGPYVENTAISFEYEVPPIEEFQNRIEKIIKKYPYLIAIENDEILGYAYAGPFYGRAAYDWSVETTIYLAPSACKKGVGRLLYETMEQRLKDMGILNLYACIAYPEVDDEYLDKNSANFHEHMGYTKVGEFHKCGYKFGRWYSMIWMEKIIGEHK